ncbi:MAG: 4-oxalomesaconate tautomerase [Gammaproteobacteria bacterium]|nr:4-oxalomesaconate tautomerase [Gammaproteobacteria bacterium]
MRQTGIPFLFMRGGTSRGPYFRREDLPRELEGLSDVLIAVLGSGHPLNIDGIGGGAAVTTKVAMLSPSDDEWADVDYFFAQVSVEDRLVDYKPTCGNILSGVGPAAIEMGIVEPAENVTEVRIRAVNTDARVLAKVATPGRRVRYDGEARIDGVPGTAAPITLKFMDVVGSSTGHLLPTGRLRDEIDGVEVTCMDVAMPLVIARASDLGVRGDESSRELDADTAFFSRMEAIRVEGGKRMGMGDVTQSVTPKFGLVSPANAGGSIAVRYFMPWKTHPSMAVTGAQCLAVCALTPGSVADGILDRPGEGPVNIILEHPSGAMEVHVDYSIGNGFQLHSVGLIRTARKLAEGNVFVPRKTWNNQSGDTG